MVYENMNKYYNIQDKNPDLKEENYIIKSGENNNNRNNFDVLTDINIDDNTERQKVEIMEKDRNAHQPKKEDKKCCCCCKCCCQCISSCKKCLEENFICNCCSELCNDCGDCLPDCCDYLCNCILDIISSIKV